MHFVWFNIYVECFHHKFWHSGPPFIITCQKSWGNVNLQVDGISCLALLPVTPPPVPTGQLQGHQLGTTIPQRFAPLITRTSLGGGAATGTSPCHPLQLIDVTPCGCCRGQLFFPQLLSFLLNQSQKLPFSASSARSLSTFDNGLKFDKQISSVVTSFFQLPLLAKVKSFLSRQDLNKAIHAFINSRQDYCNALHVGLSQSSISRLQLVQNAAVRFLTNTSRREHITPVLSSLHWLPVRSRIDFKLLLFVFNALMAWLPLTCQRF